MNKKKLDDIPFVVRIAIVVLFVCIVAPLIFYFKNVNTWLAFWGNYVGALIGAMTTIIAFSYTHKQNKDQNNALQKTNDERLRLQSLPFINVEEMIDRSSGNYIEGYIFDTNDVLYKENHHSASSVSWHTGYFYFVNIGVAPAIDVRISKSKIGIGHISLHSKKGVCFHFPNTVDYFNLSVVYQDRECRKYKQEINIGVGEYKTNFGDDIKKMYVENVTPPVLILDND